MHSKDESLKEQGQSHAERQPAAGSEFDYDSIDTGYYDAVFNRRYGIQSKWHHLKFRRVGAELGDCKRHLDIGCGPGTFIGQLPEQIRSLGVDLAAPQIAYADQHYASNNKTFQLVDSAGLPFAEQSFDAVTSVELLEHLDDTAGRSHLREALRVLSPGGRLILTTPNYHSLYPILEFFVNRLGEVSYAEQHISHYNAAKLRKMLTDCGFTDVRVVAYMFLAPFLAPLGWDLADRVERLEPRLLVDHAGFLLFATAGKPV